MELLTRFAAVGKSGAVYTWCSSDMVDVLPMEYDAWIQKFEFGHKVKQMEYSPSTDIYLLTELGDLYTMGRASLYGYPNLWDLYALPEEIKDVPIKVNIPEKFQSIELSNGRLYALGESGKLYYAYNSFHHGETYPLDTAVFRQVNFSKPIKQFLDVELKHNFVNGLRILTEDGEVYRLSETSSTLPAFLFPSIPKGNWRGKR